MDDNQQGAPTTGTNPVAEQKKVQVKVTCPHCGKDFDTEVVVPEAGEPPKMAWS